jgi:hypothetical protein
MERARQSLCRHVQDKLDNLMSWRRFNRYLGIRFHQLDSFEMEIMGMGGKSFHNLVSGFFSAKGLKGMEWTLE